jgi:hypothetical protein
MNALPVRFGLLFQLFSGWVNRRQLSVIEYLLEENRLLREQLEGRRLRLTDDERRRLAVKGKVLGRRILGEVAGIVTPDTILRWYRRLVARKYDGTRGVAPAVRGRRAILPASYSGWRRRILAGATHESAGP